MRKDSTDRNRERGGGNREKETANAQEEGQQKANLAAKETDQEAKQQQHQEHGKTTANASGKEKGGTDTKQRKRKTPRKGQTKVRRTYGARGRKRKI